MKFFYVFMLTVCISAAFAAPPLRTRNGSIWDLHSSMLEDFEENFRRMREEFDQLEKSLESGFKFPEDDLFQHGPNVFKFDPSKVKNESFSDTKIIDDKVVHTEEKVVANGNSVVHFKKVEITPKGVAASPSADKPKKVTPDTTSPSTPKVDSSAFDEGKKSELPSEENLFGEGKSVRSTPKDVEEIENAEPSVELLSAPSVARAPDFDVSNELSEKDPSEIRNPATIVDLSDDTKVNDMLFQNSEASGLILLEPEAEIIDTINNNISKTNIPNRGDSDNSAYYRYGVV